MIKSTLKKRTFGVQGPQVGEIGLGAWQLGGDCWGQIDEAKSDAILEAAREHGISFIDTADVYGGGLSEERVGRFLKRHPGDTWFVATKLGRFGDPGWPENFSRKWFTRHIEASLRRLQVEALDLAQLHCIPTAELLRGDCFEWLRELQREGKIIRWGASVESVEEGLLCLTQPGIASLQVIFNLFRQKPAEILLPRAAQQGVAIIVRVPLASGLLTGKFKADHVFPAADHRAFNADGQAFNVGETFAGLPFAKGVELANELPDLLQAGAPLAESAIRWILDHSAVTTIIPGASRPEHVAQNVAPSLASPLSPETHAQLSEWNDKRVRPYIRGPY